MHLICRNKKIFSFLTTSSHVGPLVYIDRFKYKSGVSNAGIISNIRCSPDEFKCANGKCLIKSFVATAMTIVLTTAMSRPVVVSAATLLTLTCVDTAAVNTVSHK